MSHLLDTLVAGMGRASLVLAWLAGALILACVALVTVEVVLRRTGGGLGLAHELSGYALAIAASWSFAHALFCRAHIRVDAVYLLLGPKTRGLLDALALGALLSLAIAAIIGGWDVFWGSWSRGSSANTPWQTPLWIPQLLWLVGLIWFALAAAALLVKALVALAAGHTDQVQALAGSPTLDRPWQGPPQEPGR
ncbi:MAG: TRAP transporter small permease subunit [Candidatus Competibacterales bacterium]